MTAAPLPFGERALQRQGREALCTSLEAVGPDAPTMCEGWRAIDLASHMVVRERDPWTAPVIICGRLNGMIHKLQVSERARGFEAVIGRLRGGPPWLFRSTPVAVRLNTVEDWIHCEDVRRANGLPKRAASAELHELLWRGVAAAGRVAGLHCDVGLEAVSSIDGRRTTVSRGRYPVEVVGEPGEVLLYVTGRTSVADVELRGDPTAVADVQRSSMRL